MVSRVQIIAFAIVAFNVGEIELESGGTFYIRYQMAGLQTITFT
jgi:hypothetical protein